MALPFQVSFQVVVLTVLLPFREMQGMRHGVNRVQVALQTKGLLMQKNDSFFETHSSGDVRHDASWLSAARQVADNQQRVSSGNAQSTSDFKENKKLYDFTAKDKVCCGSTLDQIFKTKNKDKKKPDCMTGWGRLKHTVPVPMVCCEYKKEQGYMGSVRKTVANACEAFKVCVGQPAVLIEARAETGDFDTNNRWKFDKEKRNALYMCDGYEFEGTRVFEGLLGLYESEKNDPTGKSNILANTLQTLMIFVSQTLDEEFKMAPKAWRMRQLVSMLEPTKF